MFEIGSPFYTVKVPFDPLFAQNWVPFLEFLGPLEIGEQCLLTLANSNNPLRNPQSQRNQYAIWDTGKRNPMLLEQE